MLKDPDLLLLVALLVATIGMALVVLGTVHGALFMPGAIALALGLLGAAAAGSWKAVAAR